MLFASYPTVGLGGWVGSAKDHLQSDPATITVWAIGLREAFLKNAGMLVSSFNSTSSIAANHPRHTFVVPYFHLTGAGVRVNWSGLGSLLTASFPQDRQTVVAEGKDHIQADPSTITASIAYINLEFFCCFRNLDRMCCFVTWFLKYMGQLHK